MNCSAEKRFWAKINKDGPLPEHRTDLGPCWIWLGCSNETGYGRFWRGTGHSVRASRFAYEASVGPIPSGLEIDHLCRNRICVNPAHLEVVTRQSNTLRGIGVTAIAARVTHCPHGHPYDLFNTYHAPRGDRRCRECKRASDVRQRTKRGDDA